MITFSVYACQRVCSIWWQFHIHFSEAVQECVLGVRGVNNHLYTSLTACIHCLCIRCNVYPVAVYTMRGKLDQLLVRGENTHNSRRYSLVYTNCIYICTFGHMQYTNICVRVKLWRMGVWRVIYNLRLKQPIQWTPSHFHHHHHHHHHHHYHYHQPNHIWISWSYI